MSTQIIVGDCRQIMKSMPEKSVHCAVTSPPYFGLRDYGHDDQLGLEATPEIYVAEMVAVFRDLHRVLRDDGTLWLNIGDSYSRSPAKGGSGPGGKNENKWGYGAAQSAKSGSSDGAVGPADRPGSRSGGLGEKQLLGIPWRLAFALQADGWYLRQDIIWHKPNPMPESVQDRCTKAHEYIFLLSKSPRYFFDNEAIAEAANFPEGPGNLRNKYTDEYLATGNAKFRTKAGLNDIGARDTRNKRSVWTVATQPFAEAHFAVFPPALIEPCILAGCPEGGMVIDPFLGSGTTAMVSSRHRRNCIGIEVNPEYAEMARRRIFGDAGMFAEETYQVAG